MSAIAEYLEPESFLQVTDRERADTAELQVQELADVLVANARMLHKQTHPILPGGMEKCRQQTCVRVRWVLGSP